MNNTTISFAVIAFALLTGCGDPAEKVHKSSAAEPQDTTSSAPASREYVIRSDSTIGFVGSKVTGRHDGGFRKFGGTISVTGSDVAPGAAVRIDMNSIWSDSDRLTGHLKSADFFDVQKFPVSTFTVTGIEPAEGQHTVIGNLELHGVTKSISFPAKIAVADEAVKVDAEFAINRKDFGINYPGKPNDLIRDNVVIKLALNATPGPAQPEDQLGN